MERISFNIRCSDINFRGEAIGTDLKDRSQFEVRLGNGEIFEINTVMDKQLRQYCWTSEARFKKLAPIIGKIIERHFVKRKSSIKAVEPVGA